MRHIYRAAAVLGLGFLLLAANDAPEHDLSFFMTPTTDDIVEGAFPTDDSSFVTEPVAAFVEEPFEFSEPELAPVLPEAGNLPALVREVRAMPTIDLDREMECLARSVYFEAKGEPLDGQLAVAQVILNRVEKGRFGNSICAVVKAPKQFSFVRGGHIPAPRPGEQWETAKAIAVIAAADGWREMVGKATHFHAVYVNPGWRLQRVAQIGNHIFYR